MRKRKNKFVDRIQAKAKTNKIVIWGVAIALVAAVGLTSAVRAEVSLLDRVAQVAGSVLGNRLADKLADKVGEIDELSFGAISGPDVYFPMNFHSGFERGGSRYATTSTAAAYTLTNTEMTNRANDVYYIDWTPNVNTTLTTQASSSMTWLGSNVGDSREFWFRNASTTAAASITFAAGTGVDLQKNEDTADLALLGLDLMKLTFIRMNSSDVYLALTEFTEAD